jgi:O-antigen chain-terminating methyltransferase
MERAAESAGGRQAVLWVGEAHRSPPSLDGVPLATLRYRFTGSDRNDGFSAWTVANQGNDLEVEVNQACQPLAGTFRQQALNREFAAQVMKFRPSVVVIQGLWGCTLDLPRLARLLGVTCLFCADSTEVFDLALDEYVSPWLDDALSCCDTLLVTEPVRARLAGVASAPLPDTLSGESEQTLVDRLRALKLRSDPPGSFDYAVYESLSRDHPLLMRMQAGDVQHFRGLDAVLDLGCGAGLLLDALRREGIQARGIERNDAVAAYGRGLGLAIETGDSLALLDGDGPLVDGINCSHFVEHLPVDAVERLLNLIAQRLRPGGVLVLTFPDPESIRSQLLGFWRDPEHVRFYHPELISSMAAVFGLTLEWSSYEAQPHTVIPFADEPPSLGEYSRELCARTAAVPPSPGLFERFLERLGLVPATRLEALARRLEALESATQRHVADNSRVLDALDERTRTLWAVNQTWAWNDNVTLRLRKQSVGV